MTIADLNYMAGIFDGEGCISIGKHKKRGHWNAAYSLKVAIVMCNAYIPNLFQFAFGGKVYTQNRGGRYLPEWHWAIAANKAVEFLKILLPYLRLKKDEAELAIRFQAFKKNKHTYPGNAYTEEEVAILEAERILLQALHNKAEVENGC